MQFGACAEPSNVKAGGQACPFRLRGAGRPRCPDSGLKAYRELETKGLAAGRPGQGTFIQATLSQIALPELTALRRPLLGWLTSADAAGLDEDGIVALFTSVLRDFYERCGGGHRDGRRAASGETEGVA